MEFIIKISQFLLSLSLLIVLHELGHFLPAKAFKTKVEKFYLFFDVKFSLFKKKIGETVYGIGWLPLGGYVKIAGMIDESMDKEQMALPPKPWEFRSKPAWQRLIIMLGGVTVNFILAYFIYVAISFTYGDTDIDTKSIKGGYLVENPVLQELGFKTGDKIISVGDNKAVTNNEIVSNIIGADEVTVERNNELKTIKLPVDFLGQLSDSKKEYGLFGMRMPFVVKKVLDTSLNKGVDLKEGDILKTIDGKYAEFDDLTLPLLEDLKGKTVVSTFERNGEIIERNLIVDDKGKLDILRETSLNSFDEMGYFDINRKEYGFGESFAVGGRKFTKTITDYWTQLGKIFSPKTGAYKGVGGFKAIFDIFPSFWSWEAFWKLTAFLSIMLAILNLLPIPALDGGHVMFLLYEMISGRKPSEKFLERAQVIGFFILIALVLFANGNDIFKAITN